MLIKVIFLLHCCLFVTSQNIFEQDVTSGIISVSDDYMNIPGLNPAPGMKKVRRKYQKELQKQLLESLMNQVAFDESGALLPGQKICLPLIDDKDVKKMSELDGKPKISSIKSNTNKYVVKAIRAIVEGDHEELLSKNKKENKIVPVPDAQWNPDYSHEKHEFIDLGHDFNIGNESFTITALIRLRPGNETDRLTNRGARIISKRTSTNKGWEFVVPSYYGQTISFFANELPGHIDYGKSTLPDNVWVVVGIVVDRSSYSDDVALITPYIDGFPDGPGTFMQMKGNLTNNAPLTIGHARDEYLKLNSGRRDFTLPGYPRFNSHFQGDIRNVSVWKSALTRQQMKKNANMLLKTADQNMLMACPEGYQELDCMCYKLFDHLKTYQSAYDYCINEGGTLAMPKTKRIQDFLEILMQQSNKWSFWIGLDDRKEENTKLWCDGDNCDYKNKVTFTKFPNGTPDKQYHTEDCVEELKSRLHFTWNDENCTKLNAFLCEIRSQKRSCEKHHFL